MKYRKPVPGATEHPKKPLGQAQRRRTILSQNARYGRPRSQDAGQLPEFGKNGVSP